MPNWQSFGAESDPIIALVGLSDVFPDLEIIKGRINSLVARGLCVKVPKFSESREPFDDLLVEPNLVRFASRIPGALTPAVSPETGKLLIVECINSGWNIAAFMGGESCENKIMPVIEYFESHPRDKSKPLITIFGMSDTTYANILANRGICNFVSTPFTNIFFRSLTDPDLQESATRLAMVLRGEEVVEFPRSLICDLTNKLVNLEPIFHYPFNAGVLGSEIKGPQLLQIPSDQRWGISVEGFIEKVGGEEINYPDLLNNFLKLHKSNPPVFVEVGNIATRRDGKGGYANLLHGDDGKILINEGNIGKIQSGNLGVDREEIETILASENEKIEITLKRLSFVANHHRVALIQNTRNGHCANMDIVAGGLIKVEVRDKEVVFSKVREERSCIQTQGADRVLLERGQKELS